MAAPFARTLRTLRKDAPLRSTAGILATTGLLIAWGAWFVLGRVTLVETSRRARLETAASVHRVQASIEARVVEVHLRVGDRVRAGELLVRLDDRDARLALQEARTRIDALRRQLAPLAQELALAHEAVARARRTASGALGEVRARERAAAAEAEAAAREMRRADVLAASGDVSAQERERAASLARAERSEAVAAARAIARVRGESSSTETDLLRRIEEIHREQQRVEGEIATLVASVERLEHAVEERRIVAPIAGRVGAAPELRVGSVVAVGEVVASIVPEGALRVVAEFEPEAALGRVRRGQTARVRMSGFPWTRFGALSATVTRVGSEVREGLVRVELSVAPAGSTRIPIEHGLPGEVEVEVERVAPLALALLSAGRLLGPQTRPDGASPR